MPPPRVFVFFDFSLPLSFIIGMSILLIDVGFSIILLLDESVLLQSFEYCSEESSVIKLLMRKE